MFQSLGKLTGSLWESHEDSSSGTGNWLVPIFFLVSCLLLSWKMAVLWNHDRQKALLSSYQEEQEQPPASSSNRHTSHQCRGRVLREMVHPMRGGKKRHVIRYIYKKTSCCSSGNPIAFVVKKHSRVVSEESLQVFGESSDIGLIKLPGHPHSGYPVDWLDDRSANERRGLPEPFWNRPGVVACLLAPLQVACAGRVGMHDRLFRLVPSSPLISAILTSFTCASLGFMVVHMGYQFWKRNLLQQNLVQQQQTPTEASGDSETTLNGNETSRNSAWWQQVLKLQHQQRGAISATEGDNDLERPLLRSNSSNLEQEFPTGHGDDIHAAHFALPPPPPEFFGSHAPLHNDDFADTIVEEAQNYKLEHFWHGIDRYRAGDWDLRLTYITLVAEYWGDSDQTDDAENEPQNLLDLLPDSAIGNLVKGEYLVQLAWEARAASGEEDTEHVEENGGTEAENATNDEEAPAPLSIEEEFKSYIQMAKQALLRSAEQDDKDPCPWAILSSSISRGNNESLETSREWYEQALRRDPWNLQAWQGRLQVLCAKWHGSHEQMYTYSRDLVRQAPKGHLCKLVHLQALEEHWQYLQDHPTNKYLDWGYWRTGQPAHMRLLTDPQTIQDTRSIYEECMQPLHHLVGVPNGGASSGSRPHHPIATLAEAQMRASVLAWLFMVGELEACRNELIQLYPWREYVAVDGSWIDFWTCWEELRTAQLEVA